MRLGNYRVGLAKIDNHNHRLLYLLKKAYTGARQNAQSKHNELLDEILHYAVFHFACEEIWMQHTHYTALHAHAQEHAQLLQKLTEIHAQVKQGGTVVPESLRAIINSTLTHIRGCDADYASSDSGKKLATTLLVSCRVVSPLPSASRESKSRP